MTLPDWILAALLARKGHTYALPDHHHRRRPYRILSSFHS